MSRNVYALGLALVLSAPLSAPGATQTPAVRVEGMAPEYAGGCRVVSGGLVLTFLPAQYNGVFDVVSKNERLLWWGKVGFVKAPWEAFAAWTSRFGGVTDAEGGGKTVLLEHRLSKEKAALLVTERITVRPPGQGERVVVDVVAKAETKADLADTSFQWWMSKTVYSGMAFSVMDPSGKERQHLIPITKGDEQPFSGSARSLTLTTANSQVFTVKVAEPAAGALLGITDNFPRDYTLGVQLFGNRSLEPGGELRYRLEITDLRG